MKSRPTLRPLSDVILALVTCGRHILPEAMSIDCFQEPQARQVGNINIGGITFDHAVEEIGEEVSVVHCEAI